MRVANGNRAVHLVEHVVPESLTDISVHPNAAIFEEKLLFYDFGHDHTGGAMGAIVDNTDNIIYNGNFEYSVCPPVEIPGHEAPVPSGVPDFWSAGSYLASNGAVRLHPGGYYGNWCLYMSIVPSGTLGASGTISSALYQPMVPPSGMSTFGMMRGADFSGLPVTLGCYASGVGQFCLGIYDGAEHWSQPQVLSSSWSTYKYTHVCSPSGSVPVLAMLCVSGVAYIDAVQANVGTRLLTNQIKSNIGDATAWRGVAHMLNNVDETADYIPRGRVVVASTAKYAGFVYPSGYGERAIGVTLAPSNAGRTGPVLVNGVDTVDIYGTVAYGEPIYAAAVSGYLGYAVSRSYLQANPDYGDPDGLPAIGISLGSKTTTGAGSVLAYVSPTPQIGTLLPKANVNETLRYDGTKWVNSANLLNDGTSRVWTPKAIHGGAKTVSDGNQTIDISDCNLVYCKLTNDTTFNATGGNSGQVVMFVLEQDNTGYRTITFNNGFIPSVATRTSGPNRVFTLLFVYINGYWYEITMYRTGIPYGVAYTWQFKMVDAVNFATPKTGRLVSVEISKEGSAFTTVTGTPPVTEIGYGWYAVTIPAVDMAFQYIILKATASYCAQTDAAIYTTVW